MVVVSEELHFKTRGELEIKDITDSVQRILSNSNLKDGIITVFVPGSTGSLTTIEYEPGLLNDLPRALEVIAPTNIPYEHNKRWHDGNGRSHVRASMLGPSLTIPFIKGKLTLGTWQQIIFLELDVRPRTRHLILQMIGE
jgi:secondary thiamine-phosphate synthase enzyme